MDERERTNETLSRILQLGSIYGVFFVLQSYGYATGIGSTLKKTISVHEGVVCGVKHLSHILIPFSKVAWPLTPTLCGLLLLYAVYLPTQLRRAQSEPAVLVANRWFFALLSAVSLTSIIALMLYADGENVYGSGEGTDLYAILPDAWLQSIKPYLQYFDWVLYSAFMAFWVLFAYWTLGRLFDRLVVIARLSDPWPDIAATLCVAWLFLLAFIGSEFDGQVDAESMSTLRCLFITDAVVSEGS